MGPSYHGRHARDSRRGAPRNWPTGMPSARRFLAGGAAFATVAVIAAVSSLVALTGGSGKTVARVPTTEPGTGGSESAPSSTASRAPGPVGEGESIDFGPVQLTIDRFRCGSELPAEIRALWKEPGTPCVAGVLATVDEPTRISAANQVLLDEQGRNYHVAPLQQGLPYDHIFNRHLPEGAERDGCLVYTLPQGAEPAALRLTGPAGEQTVLVLLQ